jgi:hypothetical protein
LLAHAFFDRGNTVADRTPSFEIDPELGPNDPQMEGHDVVGDEFIAEERQELKEERRKRSLRKPLLLLAPVVILIGALFF